MNKIKLRLFKIENYLRDEESCQFLLDEVLADGDPRLIADALTAIARWRKISKGSEESDFSDQAVPLPLRLELAVAKARPIGSDLN